MNWEYTRQKSNSDENHTRILLHPQTLPSTGKHYEFTAFTAQARIFSTQWELGRADNNIVFYSCQIIPAIYLKNVWSQRTRTGLSQLLKGLSWLSKKENQSCCNLITVLIITSATANYHFQPTMNRWSSGSNLLVKEQK